MSNYKIVEDPTVVPEGVCVITDIIEGDKVAQSEVHKVGNVCYT